MVRVYRQEHTYHHPWDRVTSAAWLKFTSPETPHVLSHITDVHTLARRLDPTTSRLHTARSITIRPPNLPFLLRRLLPNNPSLVLVHSLESSVVDPTSRSMHVVARNVSLRSLIEVEERSSYVPHPDRPEEWTLFRQETSIRCRPFSAIAALAEKIEQRCAERFLQNSAKGREFVERICGCLEKEAGRRTDASAT